MTLEAEPLKERSQAEPGNEKIGGSSVGGSAWERESNEKNYSGVRLLLAPRSPGYG